MCRSNVSNHSTNERKCIREQCRRDVCMPLCCIFFFFEFKYFFNILTKQNFHTIFWQFFFSSRIKGKKNRIKTKYWVILERKSNFWLLIHNCDSQQVRIPLFSLFSVYWFFFPQVFFFLKSIRNLRRVWNFRQKRLNSEKSWKTLRMQRKAL